MKLVDWSGERRLQREQQCKDREREVHSPLAEDPAGTQVTRRWERLNCIFPLSVPAESVRSEWKSTVHTMIFLC